MTLATEPNLARDIVIDAIHRATESVFSTMLGMTVEAQSSLDHLDHELLDGVVSLVGFTGGWIGTGMLFCSDQFACRIGSAMLMLDCKEVNSDVLDGMGEMANMILGNFKEAMEAKTGPLSLSVPTVVYGKNFSTRTPMQVPWTVVPFRIGDDVLQVRVCIKRQ